KFITVGFQVFLGCLIDLIGFFPSVLSLVVQGACCKKAHGGFNGLCQGLVDSPRLPVGSNSPGKFLRGQRYIAIFNDKLDHVVIALLSDSAEIIRKIMRLPNDRQSGPVPFQQLRIIKGPQQMGFRFPSLSVLRAVYRSFINFADKEGGVTYSIPIPSPILSIPCFSTDVRNGMIARGGISIIQSA